MSDSIIDGRGSGTTMKVDKSGAAWVTIIDENGTGPIEIDQITHALNILPFPHHEIHEGDAYSASAFTQINSGATFIAGISTGTGGALFHILYDITSSAKTEIQIFEDNTTSGGTAFTAVNRNRTSTNTSDCTCKFDPSVSGGTAIFNQSIGVKTTAGGEVRANAEWVLNSGTNYAFIATSAAANNILSARLDWYEHTNKS